jgi:L-ascorbate metabolism protein UlaG (beta-lactamase superfamily)
MQLKAAKIKDGDFIAEVDRYVQDEKHFHLWWLGQSGFLLMWKGQKVLIDPYLSDSLTTKYANTDKPHIRISERVIDPTMLTGISLVTSSHNHTDHLDQETLQPIIKNNPSIRFVIPEANREFVCARLDIPLGFPLGLSDGKELLVGAFAFHGIAACHNDIERDSQGNSKYLGYVIRFGEWSIYHSGDTILYEGLGECLRPFLIDVALLPINGNKPERKVAGNLNASEAAKLAKSIGAGVVIPCHYDMFAFNTADPKELELRAKEIGQPFHILELGGHFTGLSKYR